MSATAVSQFTNPYKGPVAFELGDRLFGRDAETDELLDILVADRIVLLYSPSGAGKTSLLEAALRPALTNATFNVLPTVRVGLTADPADQPGNRFLLSTLNSLGGRATSEPANLDLAESLNGHLDHDDSRAEVLIFDQFEEILTVDAVSEEGRRARVDWFIEIGKLLRSRRRWAIFAMREDYLAGLDPYLDAIPGRLRTRYRLDLLGVEAAIQAIQGPASRERVEISRAAAESIVSDLSRTTVYRAGKPIPVPGRYVEPVQLQVVCKELWEQHSEEWRSRPGAGQRIHVDAGDLRYDRLSVDGALGRYFDTSIRQIALDLSGQHSSRARGEEREIREWIDANLISRHGTREPVLEGSAEAATVAQPVLPALVHAHLVRSDNRHGRVWYELAHDRLVNPVRASNAAWLAANLSPLQRQARLWASQPRESQPLYLFNDSALAAAEEWLADHQEDVEQRELDFLAESREREKHRLDAERRRKADLERSREYGAKQRLANRRLTVLMLVILLLGSMSWVLAAGAARSSMRARQEANTNLGIRLGGVVAPQAKALREDDLAALLARQAALYGQESGEAAQSQILSALNGALAANPFEHVVQLHSGPANALAFSPNGDFVASAGDDGKVLIWDITHRRSYGEPLTIPAGSTLHSLEFSGDGRYLAAGGCVVEPTNPISTDSETESCSGYPLRIWDMNDLDAAPSVLGAARTEVRTVAFHPSRDRRLLASGSSDGSLNIRDLDDSANDRSLPIPTSCQVLSLAFSEDGTMLAAGAICAEQFNEGDCNSTSCVLVFEFSNEGDERILLNGPGSGAVSVAFNRPSQSGGNLFLAGGSANGTIWLWPAPFVGTSPHEIYHDRQLKSLAFAPDGQTLATSGIAHSILLWDLRTIELSEVPYRTTPATNGSTQQTNAIAYSPDGTLLATAREDGSVRLGALNTSETAPASLTSHYGEVWAVAVDWGRHRLVSGSWDGRVLLWSLKAPGILPLELPAPLPQSTCDDGRVFSLAFSEDGRRVVAGYADGTVHVWDLAIDDPTVTPRLEFIRSLAHENCVDVRDLAFVPGNPNLLASAGWDDAEVRIWDLESQSDTPSKIIKDQQFGQDAIRAIAFSPDGSFLAVGGCTGRPGIPGLCVGGGSLLVWDWQAESVVQQLCCGDRREPNEAIYSVGFSQDGHFAAGMTDGAIRLWRFEGSEFSPDADPLTGHYYSVRSVAFSEDGATLVSTSDDTTVRIWQIDEPGNPATVLNGHTLSIRSAALSPDGATIATGSADSTVRLWSLDSEKMSEAVCERVWWNLSPDEWDRYVGIDVDYESVCPNLASRESS